MNATDAPESPSENADKANEGLGGNDFGSDGTAKIGHSAGQAILTARGVTAGYGREAVLHGLDLTIHAGEIYALLGANGAGKTTTLSLLLGFLAPLSGQVRIKGFDPVAQADQARRLLAYIPENVALYGHLSARENIAYLLDLAGQNDGAAAISSALFAAGLDETFHERRVSGFSKGMRQKVAIALALARRVPALLLDEPTSGLDPQASAEFHRLLAQLRAHGTAILMVTHDLLSAADIADRIGFIEGGRLSEEIATGDGERFDLRRLLRRYAGRLGHEADSTGIADKTHCASDGNGGAPASATDRADFTGTKQ